MNVEQIIEKLEQQQASIQRAIAALKEISDGGLNVRGLAEDVARATGAADGQQVRTRVKRKGVKSIVEKSSNGAKRTMPAYNDDFRRKVVAAVRSGLTFGQAAKKFKTTWFSVREWSNSGRFEPGAESASSRKASVKAG
ncbi:MAG: hypothetical protein H7039_07360 [Bryobacteraceae bacterium]|nr:hypothetical protein [Bryobacteraceae bacterium]